jgi:uncharacterized protein (TIGR03083 family)
MHMTTSKEHSSKFTYADNIRAMSEELDALEKTLSTLSDADWRRPTRCAGWNVFALVTHINIGAHMLPELADGQASTSAERNHVSFFDFDSKQWSPVVFDYAIDATKGKTPQEVTATITETAREMHEAVEKVPPGYIGPAFFAPMRIDEFLPTRVLELAVHGLDLTNALGRPPYITPLACAITAELLDQALDGPRPEDLAQDDIAFMEVATGRRPHPDHRLPVLHWAGGPKAS